MEEEIDFSNIFYQSTNLLISVLTDLVSSKTNISWKRVFYMLKKMFPYIEIREVLTNITVPNLKPIHRISSRLKVGSHSDSMSLNC